MEVFKNNGKVMSELERWENRYSILEYLFGEIPHYFIVYCQPLSLMKGKILAVLEGDRKNGRRLSDHALSVVFIDFAPTAQTKPRMPAAKQSVKIEFIETGAHYRVTFVANS
jgi:hypothetical protein